MRLSIVSALLLAAGAVAGPCKPSQPLTSPTPTASPSEIESPPPKPTIPSTSTPLPNNPPSHSPQPTIPSQVSGVSQSNTPSETPISTPSPAPVPFCQANSDIILDLQDDIHAAEFCAKYLELPTKSVTITSTYTPDSIRETDHATLIVDAVTEKITGVDISVVDITRVETTTRLTCLDSAFTATPAARSIYKREDSKPTAIPEDWDSADVSSICSCLSIPTPTTTVYDNETPTPGTVTVIETEVVTPTITIYDISTSIVTNVIATQVVTAVTTTTTTEYAAATSVWTDGDGRGVAYRKYTHSYNARVQVSTFTSSTFRYGNPEYSGYTLSLSFGTPNWPAKGNNNVALYDRTFDGAWAALVMQGFFVAKETGTYTFSVDANYIDNWGYLWLNNVAYRDWNDGNTAIKSSRLDSGYVGGSTHVTMNKGDAIPLTWLWANGGGVGLSRLAVYTPSGGYLTDTTGYFVRACSSNVFA